MGRPIDQVHEGLNGLRARTMTGEYAMQCVAWAPEPPYDYYSLPAHERAAEAALMLRPEHLYHVFLDLNNEPCAYCCFGREAQVPGGDYSQEAVDIGLMLRPDLTGKGLGTIVVEQAVGLAKRLFLEPAAWRVSIAEFNARAQRVRSRAGFVRTQVFVLLADCYEFGVWAWTAAIKAPSRGPAQGWKGMGRRLTGPTNRL